jgi:hypothetical protein
MAMKLSEHEPFKCTCEKALKMFREWQGKDGRTTRAFIGAGDDFGNCIILFKGNEDEVFAIKRFLEHLDERNGK